MARSWGRGVEYHSTVFGKGRRPRRHIKSPQAKAGVHRLRLTLVLVVGLTIAFCV
jgi:hypothetical protein